MERGEELATTSESVIHETFYVLCSPRQYAQSHSEAVASIWPILTLRGLHLLQKRVVLEAVGLFESHRFLDFADAMSAAICGAHNYDLVSYDRDFDKIPGVERFEPGA